MHYQLYLLALPATLYFIIFCYIPMYGIQIAFRNYYPGMSGIFSAPWAGLSNFNRFFNSYQFTTILWNTLQINLLNLLLGFPVPILLAILFNEIRRRHLRNFAQALSYAPYFISAVCMAGILSLYVSENGLVNWVFGFFGVPARDYLASGEPFPWVYVLGNVWKTAGWNSIIYIAALSSIDGTLYEALALDGASKMQRILYVNLPLIAPTMAILLILDCGKTLSSAGWEQILLMQNPLNLTTSETIATYTYKIGLLGNDFSYSTAIGLFNSVVNLTLLVLVNFIARRTNREVSLW